MSSSAVLVSGARVPNDYRQQQEEEDVMDYSSYDNSNSNSQTDDIHIDRRHRRLSSSNADSNLWSVIQKKYDGLPPKGRLIAMATTGFIGSRLVLDVAVSAVKVAVVAFVAYGSSSCTVFVSLVCVGLILFPPYDCSFSYVVQKSCITQALPRRFPISPRIKSIS
jgi:hypothetical protein